jgi:hypothetical protein
MQALTAFVDKIYCINLDSRQDRWQEVLPRFEELGIADQVVRLSAVVDKDPRVGCRASHLRCVTDAMENGFENILVLEDDVLFVPENKPDFVRLCDFLCNDNRWELLYLGGVPMFPARFVNRQVFRSRFFSTHAYVANARAFARILQAGVPIDIWYAHNMVSYGVYPLYAVQGAGFSDIRQAEILHKEASMQRRYDKLVAPSLAMRWWNYFSLHYLPTVLGRS